tara:strand:+ start:46922 stop:47089 length:168 start_codon:yes stop_codon:yes gene_type:complete
MSLIFEINGHAVSAVGGFRIGSGFDTAGELFVSDHASRGMFRSEPPALPATSSTR